LSHVARAYQALIRAALLCSRPVDNHPTPPLCRFLTDRELLGNKAASQCAAARAHVQLGVPGTLKEAELGCVYDLDAHASYDKVFSLVWMDHQTLLLGTKGNHLIRVSLGRSGTTRRALRIPLSELCAADGASSPRWSTISGVAASLAAGPHIAKAVKAAAPRRWRVHRPHGEASGMQSMVLSPSGMKVAVGAAQPWDVAILDARTLGGQALCAGHSDVVFALEWLNDDIIVTGSRDRMLKVWDTRGAWHHGGAALPVLSPAATLGGHVRRVRALSYMTGPRQLASLSVDGVVCLWDAASGLTAAGKGIQLPGIVSEDTCCLVSAGPSPNSPHVASHPHMLLAGGLELYMMDVRCRDTEHSVLTAPAHDSRQGIRSLSLRDHLLTVGAADGSLSFMDMRARRYMAVRDALPGMTTAMMRETLRVGPGRRRSGNVPHGHMELSQAVFCHAWDPTHRRLATAGGPILTGMAGCYAAVWS
jgi:WD40 repeat protein